MRARDWTWGVLFVVGLVVVGAFVFEVARRFIVSPTLDLLSGGMAAFLGAFFAFLFVRFSQLLEARSERIRKGYSELVQLEYFFNLCLEVAGANTEIRAAMIKSLRTGELTANRLRPFPIRTASIPDLLDLKYIDRVFRLMVSLMRRNEDMEMHERWNEGLQKTVLQSPETPSAHAAYLANAGRLADSLAEEQKSFRRLRRKLIALISENRVRIEADKPTLLRLIVWPRRMRDRRLMRKVSGECGTLKAEFRERVKGLT